MFSPFHKAMLVVPILLHSLFIMPLSKTLALFQMNWVRTQSVLTIGQSKNTVPNQGSLPCHTPSCYRGTPFLFDMLQIVLMC